MCLTLCLLLFIQAQSDIQPGTVLTKQGDIFATVTDESPEIFIEYSLDTLKYSFEKFPDNSVKLIYNGPGDEDPTDPDVITIKVSIKKGILTYSHHCKAQGRLM